MERTLQQTAELLGLTRPALMRRMRELDLLDGNRLPKHSVRDRLYLRKKEGSWQHPDFGTQYNYSTRVTEAGVGWLRDKLGIELPEPQPDPRDVA